VRSRRPVRIIHLGCAVRECTARATNRQLNRHFYESTQQNIDHHRLDWPHCGCDHSASNAFFQVQRRTRIGLHF
jgi:hypothetical protein